MGIQSKKYLIRADCIQRLLNYFYYTNTPFKDAFNNAERLNFQLNEQPEMGLPTPEDPNVKKSNMQIHKERDRLSRLTAKNPPYMYLIETISNLVRCINIDLP